MEQRTKEGYEKSIYDLIKGEIMVVCPGCRSKAVVHLTDITYRNLFESQISITCANCGYNKVLERTPPSIVHRASTDKSEGHIIIGAPIDPFFHLPLWLQTCVTGNVLWAYNLDHLYLIKEFVGSKHRERNGLERMNKSIGSRLPKWISSNKNRDSILNAIVKMEARK